MIKTHVFEVVLFWIYCEDKKLSYLLHTVCIHTHMRIRLCLFNIGHFYVSALIFPKQLRNE